MRVSVTETRYCYGISVCPSVRPSVRPPVTLHDCVEMVALFSPPARTSLAFSQPKRHYRILTVKPQGETLNAGVILVVLVLSTLGGPQSTLLFGRFHPTSQSSR